VKYLPEPHECLFVWHLKEKTKAECLAVVDATFRQSGLCFRPLLKQLATQHIWMFTAVSQRGVRVERMKNRHLPVLNLLVVILNLAVDKASVHEVLQYSFSRAKLSCSI
jgi:hypothetical protein